MEEKLFLKLRKRYTDYGLGDELLKSFAKSACRFFDLSDEDVMDYFVENQDDFFKAIQKKINKTVDDVLKKKSSGEQELKTQLAMRVFATLAEHKGCSVVRCLAQETIDATNEIFNGISNETEK